MKTLKVTMDKVKNPKELLELFKAMNITFTLDASENHITNYPILSKFIVGETGEAAMPTNDVVAVEEATETNSENTND